MDRQFKDLPLINNLKNKDKFEFLTKLLDIVDESVIGLLVDYIDNLEDIRSNELLNTIKNLGIKDKEGVKVLAEVSLKLRGMDSLINAAQIQDDYVKQIIYNRPYFSFESKLSSILNAAKSSEGTHVIKYGNLFLNTQKDGNISIDANKGSGESRALGLFSGDMQFISQYDVNVYGSSEFEHKIKHSENNGYCSYHENIYGDCTKIKSKRVVNGGFFEKVEIENTGLDKVKVNFLISSQIKDVFEIRGKICTASKPADIAISCEEEFLINHSMPSGNTYGIKISAYEDNKTICPKIIDETNSHLMYEIELNSSDKKCIDIKIQPMLNNQPYVDGEIISDPPFSFQEALKLIENSLKTEFSKIHIEGDIPNVQKTLDRCLSDLNMLVSYINIEDKTYSYIDAGLPRYSALFGRDSIITALQVLPLNSDIAKDTLELLALFQGKTFEQRHRQEISELKQATWPETIKNAALKGIKSYYIQKEEEFGKILHEMRVGEFALTGQIPHAPYYGTVDATPLWIILYGEYFKWSKDKDFLLKLIPNAEAALEWIISNMESGYLRFLGSRHSKVKIQNQGWKDAGDSIKHLIGPKGHLIDPEYPIALAEVQGYTYQAFSIMSELYEILDDKEKSTALKSRADMLKERFNHDFWLDDEGFYTMALDKDNNPIPNITSNIGHCLSMGIINNDRKSIIEDKLMSAEMFNGWGIRTLGTKCPGFDPISYHNGSVWVHDTAFVATGLSDESKSKIITALFEAANMFEDNRLPELFGGFQRKPDDKFIQRYPEACAPQAWASGSLIWLLLNISGLQNKDTPPVLPDWIKKLSVNGVTIENRSKINTPEINIKSTACR